MSGRATTTIINYVRGLATSASAQRLPDGQLLERFVQLADADAFAELLRRYAQLVWRVCRQLLPANQDAEDAFQATFLLLARKASTVRQRDAVAGWLQGAACRISMELRRGETRRRAREKKAPIQQRATVSVAESELDCRDLLAALHEEAGYLPVSQRNAFVLCGLEGLTVCEAAIRLGRPEGTVSWCLGEARKRLRSRLAKRGIILPAVLALLALAKDGRAAVRPALVSETARVAVALVQIDAGPTGVVSDQVLTLIRKVNRPMCLSKYKVFAICLMTASLAVGLAGQVPGPRPLPTARAAEGNPAPAVPAIPEVEGEGTFGGTVVDAISGKPVKGVTVLVRRLVKGKPSGEIKLASDVDGRFKFDLPADWAKSTDAEVAVTVEAPPGYVGFSYRMNAGYSVDDGVAIEELLREKKLKLSPYFCRMLLFTTKPVKGRVLDPDGKPAADVNVVVSSVHLKEKVHHRLVRQTKTDADGRFATEVASPGPAVLHILPEQYAVKVNKLTDPEGDLGDFKLEAGLVVAGKLRDAKDRPLPGRWVRVGTTVNRTEIDDELWNVGLGGGVARWCRTEPNGTFRTGPLPAGDYEVSAHDPGKDPVTGREQSGELLGACVLPQKVKLTADKAPERIVLRAVPHVIVEMKVSDRDGKPRGNEVKFFPKFTFDKKEYWTIAQDWGSRAVQDGRAVLYVPHGTSRLEMWVSVSNASVTCKLRPESITTLDDWTRKVNEDTVGVTLVKLEQNHTLEFLWAHAVDASFRVSTKDGSPLPADLEIDARHSGSFFCSLSPSGDGVYRLWHCEPDRPLRINVKAEGWEPVTKTVTIPGGSPQQVEVVLEKKVVKK
jgi:RNA polymerase sigma factor (sigma-70 family)